MPKDIEPILKVLDNPLLMPAPVDQDKDLLRHLYHPPLVFATPGMVGHLS